MSCRLSRRSPAGPACSSCTAVGPRAAGGRGGARKRRAGRGEGAGGGGQEAIRGTASGVTRKWRCCPDPVHCTRATSEQRPRLSHPLLLPAPPSSDALRCAPMRSARRPELMGERLTPGPFAGAILRFTIVFPRQYPRVRPQLFFDSDVFHRKSSPQGQIWRARAVQLLLLKTSGDRVSCPPRSGCRVPVSGACASSLLLAGSRHAMPASCGLPTPWMGTFVLWLL